MKNIIFIAFQFNALTSHAQKGKYDTILLGGIPYGNDTLPVMYIQDVDIYAKLSPERREELRVLRYNVYKVYPYAITAAFVLNKVDNEMDVRTKKRDRKHYLKEVEKEMNSRFKGELKNLSITQGKILVKLINRQTGRDVYDIVKDVKGGFNARIYQTTAFFFDNNLKKQYDPFGEDKDIEMIVKELEGHQYLKNQKLPLPARLTSSDKK